MRHYAAIILAALLWNCSGTPAYAAQGGFPSRPTFQVVKVGTQATATGTSGPLEIQSPVGSGSGIDTFRNTNTSVGLGRLSFDALNASSARVTYGFMQGSVVTNTAGAHRGRLEFYAADTTGSTRNVGLWDGVTGLSVAGKDNNYAATFTNGATAGQSYGVNIQAGTNSSDFALRVQSNAGGSDLFRVQGDGGMIAGSGRVLRVASAETNSAGTLQRGFNITSSKAGTGSYTFTLTGFSATPVCTASQGTSAQGVTLVVPTSNTSMGVSTWVGGVATDLALFVVCVGM